MRGTIKWFSEQKRHGFLIGDDGNEYHIHIKEVKGAILPKNGDIVEFDESRNNRGLTAKNIVIIKKSDIRSLGKENNDDRIVCRNPACGKKIVPRIITYTPTFYLRGTDRPKRSICPYCGTVVNRNLVPYKPCFIATAVYGDSEATQIQALRLYRDTTLLTNPFGRVFVKLYYFVSPPLAKFIEANKSFASPIKYLLDKIVRNLPK